MIEQLIDDDILIPVVAIVCTFSWLTIATLSASFKSMFSIWRNTRLKERMLERGLSAREIQMVMGAGKSKKSEPKKKGAAPVTSEAYEASSMTQTHY